MKTPTNIESHIRKIRDSLWKYGPKGRAAVMVGSGFSLNADHNGSTNQRMLTWSFLKEKMLDGLDINRSRDHSGKSALRIAQEYEAAFGRIELDKLILSSVPDDAYEPGLLHRYLLELPWADIFTTNYDTLLERTRQHVFERKYDLVQTLADIASTQLPRITKLHGSFPSHRPFIVTEEDFRTYPHQFAPFINMVQQSLMENVFCLLGFSGDDPNFLEWTGWVRDNLGKHTPNLYLVGLLDLDEAQRRLLEQRNVVPVDLATVFPGADFYDSGKRHKAALEWFLLSLLAGREANTRSWPQLDKAFVREPKFFSLERFPAPIPQKQPFPEERHDYNTANLEYSPEVLGREWRAFRGQYPGWLVLPSSNREHLWYQTRQFIEKGFQKQTLLDRLKQLTSVKALPILYELCWRLNRCLIPYFTDDLKYFEEVVEQINPFPRFLDMPEVSFRPDAAGKSDLNWHELGEAWVEVVFALMRTAREDFDLPKFDHWSGYLHKVISLNTVWEARWHYEKSQYFLARCQQRFVLEQVQQWPETTGLPEWTLKKAAVLAEIGKTNDAKRLALETVNKVRERLRTASEDLYALSIEAYALHLLICVGDWSEFDARGEYFNRLTELKTFNCDPFDELNQLTSELEPAFKQKYTETQVYGFDPGNRSITRSHNLGSADYDKILRAFSVQRLVEEAGIPLHCPSVTTVQNLDKVASLIWFLSPLQAVGIYLRSSTKTFNAWWSRLRIAGLSNEQVDILYTLAVSAIQQGVEAVEMEAIPRRSYSFSVLQALFEFASRLCYRLDDGQIMHLFNVTEQAYLSTRVRQDLAYHDPLNNLFKRLFIDRSKEVLTGFVERILYLPLPSELGKPDDFSRLIDPARHLVTLSEKVFSEIVASNLADVNSLITRLVAYTDSENIRIRSDALWRVILLNKLRILSEEQKGLFARALWRQVDGIGLPMNTSLYPMSFLFLPEPEVGIAKTKLKLYLTTTDIPDFFRQSGKYVESSGEPAEILFNTWRNCYSKVDLELGDIVTLCARIVSWWNREKEVIIKNGSRLDMSGVQDRFQGIASMVLEVIMPNIKDLPKLTLLELKQVLEEIKEARSLLDIDLFLLGQNPSKNAAKSLANKLRARLRSGEQMTVREAILTCSRWYMLHAKELLPKPPKEILSELINRIRYRKPPLLTESIEAVTRIFEFLPSEFKKGDIEDVLDTLETLEADVSLISREGIDSPNIVFNQDELPHILRECVHLASKLYSYYQQNKKIPEILTRWKVYSLDSPLPEIKTIFQNP